MNLVHANLEHLSIIQYYVFSTIEAILAIAFCL